jgi:cytosine/adenosine deaminase-related metal-dependent hydrolase
VAKVNMEGSDILISSPWIVPITSPPIQDGGILISNKGKILSVGKFKELKDLYPNISTKIKDSILMPAFINVHTHLELSGLKGKVKGGKGLIPWIKSLMINYFSIFGEESRKALLAAVQELKKYGTIAVGEVSSTLAAVKALGEMNIKGIVFHEVLGFRSSEAERILKEAREIRKSIDKWPSSLLYRPSPHAPYSTSPDLIRLLAKGRTSIHLGEDIEEEKFLLTGEGAWRRMLEWLGAWDSDWSPPGLSPLRYIDSLGVLHSELLLVHMNTAKEEDLELTAKRGASVVICPRSTKHISGSYPPLKRFLRCGVKLALGTDSLASCPDLDLRKEIKVLSDRYPDVSPRTLLFISTQGGADALGLGNELGSLEPGKSPGIIAIGNKIKGILDPERFLIQNIEAPIEWIK